MTVFSLTSFISHLLQLVQAGYSQFSLLPSQVNSSGNFMITELRINMLERSINLSIVIPVFNEEENIPLLHERLVRILKEQNYSFEVIYVDDGSTDGTFSQLQSLAMRDQQVQVIQLRRNFGQTAALAAGVDHSTGKILVFMDGDLQNDPVDIPRLLAKLDEGYDVVSGWRKHRQDGELNRKLPSWID